MIDPILGPVIAAIWPYIAGLLAGLALWFGVRRSAKKDAEVRDMRDHINTRRRMDDAPNNAGATDDTVLDRLRDHAKR